MVLQVPIAALESESSQHVGVLLAIGLGLIFTKGTRA